MLTKADFDQIGKLVRKIVREEVETETKDAVQTLRTEIKESRMRVQSDIRNLDDRVKNVEVRMDGLENKINGIEKDLKDVKKRVRKTEKTVDVMIDQFDRGIVGTQKQVTKTEDHLQI